MNAIEIPSPERISRMQAVFGKICNPRDWKSTIDAIIPTADAAETMDAIRFMTATEPVCTQIDGGLCRITSEGYRRGPAGDH